MSFDLTRAKSALSLGFSALIVIALIIIVGFGIFLSSTFNLTSTTSIQSRYISSTGTVTINATSTNCFITGQPGGIFLTVLSDSNATPVIGAQIAATNQPAGVNGSPCGKPATVKFTTRGAEWYQLASDNNAGYSITVTYSGQTYNFTARLAPVSLTCATLFVPSGRTNVTITEFGMSCSTASAITTTANNSNSSKIATVTNSTNGLSFTLSLNSTNLMQGQAINITAYVTNDRSTFNNLTWAGPGGSWSEGWFIGWGMIDSCNSFANAQVFQGYYTQSNISSLQSGTELQLAKPLIPPMECPFIPGAWYTYFPFQPHESKVGYQYSTQGDYGKANQSSSTLQLFNPGVYTVAAGDEWGQMVILHFVVSASIPTTTTSRTAISSSNSIPNNVVPCSTTYPNGSSDGTTVFLAQQSGSTANICVRYFYYNSSATTTINTLDQLTIYSPVLSSGSLSNANSSFSISASIPQFQIGGPQMENEGILVAYTIRSTGSAPSATYEIGLSSALYPQDIISGWGIYIILQVGNTTNAAVGTSSHYVPAPQDNPGLVYSEIVGITNSTK